GDIDRASTLAAHALLIGFCFGLTFMLGMLIFGPALLELLGGRGNVLTQAVAYTQVFFGGAVLPWLMNTMSGILRGTGNMKLPSVLTISIFTHMLASFGTEILAGYGIGARLEFMLTSISFAVGIATVPMVGMAIGAERIARARRICWIAGLVAFVSVGAVASFIAVFPDIWVNLFTDDASVRAA